MTNRMFRRIRVRETVAVCLSIAAVMSVAALPANAHDRQSYLHAAPPEIGDVAHGGVNEGHRHVWVCDDRADGLGVRLYYELASGQEGYISDGNGSRPGCGGAYPGTSSNPVRWYWLASGPSGDPQRNRTPEYGA
jgi:hypothetical protein